MQNLLHKEKRPTPEPLPSPVIKETVVPKTVDKEEVSASISAPVSNPINKKSLPQPRQSFQLKKYVLYLPLLLTSITLSLILRFIFQHVEPTLFQNVVLPNFYLPIVLLVAAITFFGVTYLLMNVRRGLLVTVSMTILFIAQLHQLLSIFSFIFIILPVIGLEIFLTRRQRR